MKKDIRSDEYGPYVLAGGYAFRPAKVAEEHFPDDSLDRTAQRLLDEPSPPGLRRLRQQVAEGLRLERREVLEAARTQTRHEVGSRVRATHLGGTHVAIVGGETWVSRPADPRYAE